MIDLNDTHLDMLVKFHHVEGVGDATIGHLGDMYQTILMDTDIDKGSEVGDVGDDARQNHAFHQVVDGVDILVELEFLSLLTGIAPRFFQFLEDIGEGGDAHFGSDVLADVDGLALLLIINKVGDSATMILSHLFDDGIALRMNRRIVEGILGAMDAQETSTLLVG